MRSSIIIIIIDAALWKHHSCALSLILNPRFSTITLEEPLYSLKLDKKKGMANHHYNLCWKTMLVAAQSVVLLDLKTCPSILPCEARHRPLRIHSSRFVSSHTIC